MQNLAKRGSVEVVRDRDVTVEPGQITGFPPLDGVATTTTPRAPVGRVVRARLVRWMNALVGVLGIGLVGILWSALGQLESAAPAGGDARIGVATPGSTGSPGVECWRPASGPGVADGTDTYGVDPAHGTGRWVFVQHDGVGGYVLTGPGQPRPGCGERGWIPVHR